MSNASGGSGRRQGVLARLALRAELEHRMRDWRAIGDLHAAEPVSLCQLDAFTEASVADHPPSDILDFSQASERSCLIFGRADLAGQFEAAPTLHHAGKTSCPRKNLIRASSRFRR
jgi:hypothetical protein